MTDAVMLYSTWPDEAAAAACAEALIAQRLAACVTVLPGSQSVYRWDGQIERCAEHPMLVKTSAAKAGAARDAILALHPYELPSIVAFTIVSEFSHVRYLNWIASETS